MLTWTSAWYAFTSIEINAKDARKNPTVLWERFAIRANILLLIKYLSKIHNKTNKLNKKIRQTNKQVSQPVHNAKKRRWAYKQKIVTIHTVLRSRKLISVYNVENKFKSKDRYVLIAIAENHSQVNLIRWIRRSNNRKAWSSARLAESWIQLLNYSAANARWCCDL